MDNNKSYKIRWTLSTVNHLDIISRLVMHPKFNGIWKSSNDCGYPENTKKEAGGKQLSLTRQKKQNRINLAPLKLNSDLLINFVKANKGY